MTDDAFHATTKNEQITKCLFRLGPYILYYDRSDRAEFYAKRNLKHPSRRNLIKLTLRK